MQWFEEILDIIDIITDEIPNFLDTLYKTLFDTLGEVIENSGVTDFFKEIPFLGTIINTIIKWLTGPLEEYTLISFMIGNGIGLFLLITFIKWVRGLA